jgi:hypothetical protein
MIRKNDMNKNYLRVTAIAGLLFSTTVHSTLIDRGGGLIYDDVLNVTWLQNANLAASEMFGLNYGENYGTDAYGNPSDGYGNLSYIKSDGTMTWSGAKKWIAAMNAAYYLGYNDWRLPITAPVNGTAFNYFWGVNGTTDAGYNMGAPGTAYEGSTGSEMASLYYNTLGNQGFVTPTGMVSGCISVLNYSCLQNTGPFQNLVTGLYWSGTGYASYAFYAWGFEIGSGAQGDVAKDTNYHAMVVRSGDVAAAVPEPATLILVGLGFAGLVAMRRRR